MAGHAEVAGSGELLCHLIDSGEIPIPNLLGFNDWQIWRAGAGRRPTRNRDGYYTTQKHEATLWRTTMEAQYGEDWIVDLAAQQTAGGNEADDGVTAAAVTSDGTTPTTIDGRTWRRWDETMRKILWRHGGGDGGGHGWHGSGGNDDTCQWDNPHYLFWHTRFK